MLNKWLGLNLVLAPLESKLKVDILLHCWLSLTQMPHTALDRVPLFSFDVLVVGIAMMSNGTLQSLYSKSKVLEAWAAWMRLGAPFFRSQECDAPRVGYTDAFAFHGNLAEMPSLVMTWGFFVEEIQGGTPYVLFSIASLNMLKKIV